MQPIPTGCRTSEAFRQVVTELTETQLINRSIDNPHTTAPTNRHRTDKSRSRSTHQLPPVAPRHHWTGTWSYHRNPDRPRKGTIDRPINGRPAQPLHLPETPSPPPRDRQQTTKYPARAGMRSTWTLPLTERTVCTHVWPVPVSCSFLFLTPQLDGGGAWWRPFSEHIHLVWVGPWSICSQRQRRLSSSN